MSRNLGMKYCVQCGSAVRLTNEPSWYDNASFQNLANAECIICRTRYAAWLGADRTIEDLSYRSTLNDEPGEGDIPASSIERFTLIVVDGVPFILKQDF